MADISSPKSFFTRPEGTTGLIFLTALGVGGSIALYRLLPFIITLLQNALYASFLGGIVLLIVACVMNKKFRATVSYAFKSVMRKITGLLIEIDPIGILKGYLEDMDDRIGQIMKNITSLKQQIGKLKRSIEDKKEAMNTELRTASHAKKKGENMQATLHSRNAGRNKESVERLQKIYDKMEMLYRVLTNMRKKIQFLRDDTENTVEMKESEYLSIKAAHKAMSGAKKLLFSGDSKKDIFEQTLQHIADDVGMKMGEMDEFMEMSEDFIANVDLQEGMFDEKGMELLEQWEKGDSSLLGDDKQTILDNSHNTKKQWNEDVEVVMNNTQSQYSNLFN